MRLPKLRELKEAVTAVVSPRFTTRFPAEPCVVPERYRGKPEFDPDTCIGCGACVASCKNASAMLFVAAKVAQFSHLPQGQAEKRRRVLAMVETMDKEGFGNCTNFHECEAVCPKEISVEFIAELNRNYLVANVTSE